MLSLPMASLDIRGAIRSSFTIPESVCIVLKGRLIQTSLPKLCRTPREERVGNGFNLVGKNNVKVCGLIPDDCNLRLEDRTLSCLWLDAGIAQDIDLHGEPERYSGEFGIALLYKKYSDGIPVYTRVGFVMFHGPMVKQIHKVGVSRFGLV